MVCNGEKHLDGRQPDKRLAILRLEEKQNAKRGGREKRGLFSRFSFLFGGRLATKTDNWTARFKGISSRGNQEL